MAPRKTQWTDRSEVVDKKRKLEGYFLKAEPVEPVEPVGPKPAEPTSAPTAPTAPPTSAPEPEPSHREKMFTHASEHGFALRGTEAGKAWYKELASNATLLAQYRAVGKCYEEQRKFRQQL